MPECPINFRVREDSVEIACCLFNKGLLAGDTIDAAAEEIEAWIKALVADQQSSSGAVNGNATG